MLIQVLLSLFLVSLAYGECPATLAKDVTCRPIASRCYCFSYIQADWNTADSICRSNPAHPDFRLVSIESSQEQDVLEGFIGEIPGLEVCRSNGFWTAGNDLVVEGDWVWSSTGDRLTFTNWAIGQPEGPQDCLLMDRAYNYKWHDYWCETVANFICEGPSA